MSMGPVITTSSSGVYPVSVLLGILVKHVRKVIFKAFNIINIKSYNTDV